MTISAEGERFPRKRLGTGYSVDEVDAFFQRVDARIVTAQEAERVTFHSTFRGYDEQSVDEALERYVDSL